VKWGNTVEAEADAVGGKLPTRKQKHADALQVMTLADALLELRDEMPNERWRLHALARCRVAKLRIQLITVSDVSKWRDRRLRDAKPSTVVRELSIMQTAIDRAASDMAHDEATYNPVRHVKRPRVDDRRERRLFVNSGNHSNDRPQIGVNYTKMRIARFIVAVRDELDMLGEWDTRHTCNVRACVNPDHLLSGTRQDNALDRYEQGTAPVGERAPNAQLTEQAVREVHKLASSMTQASIADQFGVSSTTISNILNGVTWRHVYDEVT